MSITEVNVGVFFLKWSQLSGKALEIVKVGCLPSGELTKSNGTWPFIVDFPIDSMVIFHCYVSSPEGSCLQELQHQSSRTRFLQGCTINIYQHNCDIIHYSLFITVYVHYNYDLDNDDKVIQKSINT